MRKDFIMGFYIAMLFLTRIPLPQIMLDEKKIASAVPFFPLVGGAIGGILLIIQSLGKNFLPVPAMAVILVALNTIITGGMHLDGFADTMDGLFCGGDREKKLAVMKDSCSGAYGVMGISLVFLLKYVLLTVIPANYLGCTLLSFPLLSRWVMTFAIIFFPYGRKKGLGKAFTYNKNPMGFYIGSILVIGLMYLMIGIHGIIATIITFIMGIGFILYIIKQLGGLTGDTYGALNEFCEIIALLVFVILSHI